MMSRKRVKLEDLNDIPKECIATAHKHLEAIKKTTDAKLIYLHCYQLMKLGGLDAEVPRLVVFGQQSMGKTTLLDFIMGGPIGYSSTDTGTKQPVSIIIRPVSAINSASIPNDPGVNDLRSGEEDATVDDSKILCLFKGRIMDIRKVQDAMRAHMQSLGDSISSEELEVEVYVPDAVNAIFVDLPGIKDDSKAGAEFTRSVVRNYVSNNPNDLYLLVKKSSDDPANWPWSLREFITASAPSGLGLTPKQTMVVGTRAKEFLLNEKTDIRTQEQLMERVRKRAVFDSKGQMLPLHLLELFSLSIKAKEFGEFSANKEEMKNQIIAGQLEVQDLILNCFDSTENNVIGEDGRTLTETLLSIFSIKSFLKSLNNKFQSLLNLQLINLERRLVRKKMELERITSSLEGKLSRFLPKSIDESIKRFVHHLVEVVYNMVTGNYTIMKLPIPPDQFLSIYGGNLRDNLEDGHELALNLFPQSDLYDADFYQKITNRTESLYNRKLTLMDAVKPGRYVRYFTSKINSHMFGLVEPPLRTNTSVSSIEHGSSEFMAREYGPNELINVEFIQVNNGEESSLHKNIDRNRLALLIPLPSVAIEQLQVPLYAWHKTQAPTGWILVRPIIIDRLPPEILIQKSNYREVDIANKQISFRYIDEDLNGSMTTSGITEADDNDNKQEMVQADDERSSAHSGATSDRASGNRTSGSRFLYVTTCSEIYLEERRHQPYYASALEMVSGEHAEANLLNQLAITNICNWLKFQIKHMEPENVYTAEVLYQMLRSIHYVVDRADWEPLIADLVQSNVRGTLLHATRLAACAAAAALRRVLRASLAEVFRCIQLNDSDHTLYCLSESLHFQEQIDQLSEEFCRQKALECAEAMMSLIFEQTYSIQFDVAIDIFDGCHQFEKDFMVRAGHRSRMDDALDSVRENLALRKRRLAMTDLFEKGDTRTSIDLIYEEVRVQFWATKTLLCSPLTTKLYTHFIKQVVERGSPTLAEDPAITRDTELEEFLQTRILYELVDGNLVPRSNGKLAADYDLNSKYENFLKRYDRSKRLLEYVSCALEGICRFKHQTHSEETVDFLAHFDRYELT